MSPLNATPVGAAADSEEEHFSYPRLDRRYHTRVYAMESCVNRAINEAIRAKVPKRVIASCLRRIAGAQTIEAEKGR